MFISLSPEVYSIDYVPFAPRRQTADGWRCSSAVSFVATLYPSWSASRILPAEALRMSKRDLKPSLYLPAMKITFGESEVCEQRKVDNVETKYRSPNRRAAAL